MLTSQPKSDRHHTSAINRSFAIFLLTSTTAVSAQSMPDHMTMPMDHAPHHEKKATPPRAHPKKALPVAPHTTTPEAPAMPQMPDMTPPTPAPLDHGIPHDHHIAEEPSMAPMAPMHSIAPMAPTATMTPPASPPSASTTPSTPADHGGMAGMEMSGMDMGQHAGHMGHVMMNGALGGYSMTRDASGTAWQPDSEQHHGLHRQFGSWSTMLHGYLTAIYDDQGGLRGATKGFVQSHFMGTAQRPIGKDTLTFHAALSLDPLMGNSGYPLLLQTGETADGKTPLIDRQHPHNFFSELSATYSHPLAADTNTFLYVGYPGEPALGPVTYLHRFAGMANPETPIDHHWLDSTHITFGVVTAGITKGPFKLEASDFTGREPDQNRWGFNPARFDSWSTRLTFNPSANLSMQVSYGDIHSPEQLTPEVNQKRITASVTYNRPFTHGNWETTVAWGQDNNQPGNRLNAYLLESAVQRGADTVFGRAEHAQKDELFLGNDPLNGRIFDVSKFSVGYFHTVPLTRALALDIGGVAGKYALPSALKPSYGSDPTSFMLFIRVKFD